MNLVDHALAYARIGWSVLPLSWVNGPICSCYRGADCTSPGKHPLTQHGVKDASVDDTVIRRWWRDWPEANIGVATGMGSGIIVLDVDPRHGGPESLRAKIRIYGDPPHTVLACTGGHPDGRHVYWKHPGGSVIRNSAGIIPGIDVRGDGGYVVAPPSLHASGARYSWFDGRGPDEIELATPPTWFYFELDRERQETRAFARPWRGLGKRFNPAMVTHIGEGERNQRLASIAGRLLFEKRDISEAERVLIQVNNHTCRPPLSDKEVVRVVRSIYGRYRRA